MSRGLGRWERAILRQLDKLPEVLLIAVAWAELGKLPTRSQESSLNRAAHSLERKGLCTIGLVEIDDKRGRAQSHTLIRRPGLSDAPPVVVEGEEPVALPVGDWDQAATAWIAVHHYAAMDHGAWAVGRGHSHRQARWIGHDDWDDDDDDCDEWHHDALVDGMDEKLEELDAEPFQGPYESQLHDYDNDHQPEETK